MKKSKPHTNALRQSGTVLIVVIWVVLVLASLAIVFGQYVRVEAMAANNQASMTVAEMVANGAIQYAFSMMDVQEDSQTEYSTNPYEAVQAGGGYFWIARPNLEDDRNYDYGLTDEAGKVNLNTASLEMLLKLPSMTSELANSIIDWRDGNQEISSGGAESEYYLLLQDPYYCKDAPLETVEEVLLIRGGDLQALYGEDYNRNGVLDLNENDASDSSPADNKNGKLDSGFFNYVTVYSAEPNTDSEGNERINIKNTQAQGQLLSVLKETVGDDQALLLMPRFRGQFANLLDLYYRSTMKYEDFGKIIDKLTLTDEKMLRGLINVNTASEKVLLCLPGLEQSDVDAMVRYRTEEPEDLTTIIWVTKALSQEKAVAIGSYITTASYQMSADITAASANGRAFCRYFVVIDKTAELPQVVLKQSLRNMGWSLEPKILEDLRNGTGISSKGVRS